MQMQVQVQVQVLKPLWLLVERVQCRRGGSTWTWDCWLVEAGVIVSAGHLQGLMCLHWETFALEARLRSLHVHSLFPMDVHEHVRSSSSLHLPFDCGSWDSPDGNRSIRYSAQLGCEDDMPAKSQWKDQSDRRGRDMRTFSYEDRA